MIKCADQKQKEQYMIKYQGRIDVVDQVQDWSMSRIYVQQEVKVIAHKSNKQQQHQLICKVIIEGAQLSL